MKILKLGEVVDIYSGQIMSRVIADRLDINHDYSTTVKVIMPKAINADGLIDEHELIKEDIIAKEVNSDKKNYHLEYAIPIDEKRFTKVDDIVIKLSTPFDSATITDTFQDCIVPSFCAIIRNKDLVKLDYLQAFLNSKLCKEQLKSKVSGAVNTILTIGKIKDVDIPIPDEEQQVIIGKKYRETQKTISVLKQIVKLETKRNDVIFINMVK